MKKYSAKYILTQILIYTVIGVAAGTALPYFTHMKPLLSSAIAFSIIALFFLWLVSMSATNSYSGKIARKTMQKGAEAEQFGQCSTFTAAAPYTLGQILKIDSKTGRVAYVSYQNPKQFQLVHARELTNITSSYVKGPFGGTRYVYFEFYYKNKRVRFATFTSRSMYSLKSKQVLEAISKGDMFRDILLRAQTIQG
ncbi:MAG: hypothetical protein J5636_02865 [Clostridiales bacterium]|nr:hypothetical protein [Clostridiales bacterium]